MTTILSLIIAVPLFAASAVGLLFFGEWAFLGLTDSFKNRLG